MDIDHATATHWLKLMTIARAYMLRAAAAVAGTVEVPGEVPIEWKHAVNELNASLSRELIHIEGVRQTIAKHL